MNCKSTDRFIGIKRDEGRDIIRRKEEEEEKKWKQGEHSDLPMTKGRMYDCPNF